MVLPSVALGRNPRQQRSQVGLVLLCLWMGFCFGWFVAVSNNGMDSTSCLPYFVTKSSLSGYNATVPGADSDKSSQGMTSEADAASTLKETSNSKKSLTELLQASESDKYHKHHYENYYENWLEPFRSINGVKMLEIGSERGHSLQIWANYFDRPGRIQGVGYGHLSFIGERRWSPSRLDHEPKTKNNQDSPRPPPAVVQIYHGDQSKVSTMQYLKQNGPWHVIMDDGSHVPWHVKFTLFHLWPTVVPGGLYIVEDLETNYWNLETGTKIYGYNLTGITGLDHVDTVPTKLFQLVHVLQRRAIGATELGGGEDWEQGEDGKRNPHRSSFDAALFFEGYQDVCAVLFGMNVAALQKCTTGTIKPPYNPKVKYSRSQMAAWMERVKQTNPKLSD